MTTSWIRTLTGTSDPSLKLFCLPHAGGNAGLYKGWRERLPAQIELNLICYPGRLDRWDHPIPDSMAALSSAIADAMMPHISGRWAIFGHSMGAVAAHETVQQLTRWGAASPALLAVSAREAPQFHQPGTLHRQSDEALVSELLRLGGTDPALLAIPEMRDLILPTMRADYALIERWEPGIPQRLNCPIAVFTGCDDPELDAAQAEGWAAWTTARFTHDRFAGGHFYFQADPQPLIAQLLERLEMAQALP